MKYRKRKKDEASRKNTNSTNLITIQVFFAHLHQNKRATPYQCKDNKEYPIG
jgi:hypothetical protein